MMSKLEENNPALFREYMRKNHPQVYEIPLKRFNYNKRAKTLGLSSEFTGMPQSFYVISHHTGRKVLFKSVQPGDKLWDEDGWDGEQCVYRPVESIKNVEYAVIYNEY